jgi:hypothetical protein
MAERNFYKPNPPQSRLKKIDAQAAVKNSLSAACDIAESVRQLSKGDGVLTLLPLNLYIDRMTRAV